MINKIFKISINESRWEILFFGFKISHNRKPKAITSVSGINNKIFINEKGKREQLRKPIPGLNIQISGNGNVIELGRLSNIKNCQIIIVGNNNSIKIAQSQYLIENTSFDMRVLGYNRKIDIDENFSSNGAVIWNEENESEIDIGRDVMFGHNIFIRNSDGHLIFDKYGNHINKATKITIGNHAWVGAFVNILKNTHIDNGCIIGTGSIVTKSTEEPNCIYAGIPAKRIKTEINWDRLTPNLYYQTNKINESGGNNEHI